MKFEISLLDGGEWTFRKASASSISTRTCLCWLENLFGAATSVLKFASRWPLSYYLIGQNDDGICLVF